MLTQVGYFACILYPFTGEMEERVPGRVEEGAQAVQESSHAPRVSVGDVVIIHSESQPRGMWNLGRVEELIIGNDGEASTSHPPNRKSCITH